MLHDLGVELVKCLYEEGPCNASIAWDRYDGSAKPPSIHASRRQEKLCVFDFDQ